MFSEKDGVTGREQIIYGFVNQYRNSEFYLKFNRESLEVYKQETGYKLIF